MRSAVTIRMRAATGGIATIALLATLMAGCTAPEPSTEAPQPEPDHPEYAIHMVTTTSGKAPDPGQVAGDPWKLVESRTEYWVAAGDSTTDDMWYRTSHATFESVGSTETVYRQEELVHEGVWYVLQGDSPRPEASASEWFNLLEYDSPERLAVEEEHPTELADEPLLGGNVDYYREAMESGLASTVAEGEVDGTPTFRLILQEQHPWDPNGGKTLTVEIAQDDFLPLSLLREEWQYDPPGQTVERRVDMRRYITYPTIEIVPWEEVPVDAFELAVPDGIQRVVNRHMSIDEAASLRAPVMWWVGESRGSFELAEEPVLTADSGAAWSHGHPGPDDVESADLARPLASQATTAAIVHYEGSDGADLKITSIPWIDLSDSKELKERETYWELGDAIERLEIDGRAAVLQRGHVTWSSNEISSGPGTPDTTPTGVGTGQQTYFHLIVDMGESTAIIQGWKIPESEVIAIAKELARIRGQ